jgi:hypothetical protein
MDGLTGVDCTAIEGVADVACLGGRCIVHRCMPGYKVRTRGSESRCVSDERSVDAMDVLAAEFGLDLVL